ncbi:MAG: T9SS type A sorting domain-containing protein, partial [candidate division Zixibacteria bacterium]|nr:T9SS type A sorting domain-containing protein [candidate division Zixibacteria bacterium]
NVTLEIFNLQGQKMGTLVNSLRPAGEHRVHWDASSYSSGIYFYRLIANGKVFTKKMNLLK